MSKWCSADGAAGAWTKAVVPYEQPWAFLCDVDGVGCSGGGHAEHPMEVIVVIERVFKIMLEDLKVLRLVCARDGCGAVIEMSLEQFLRESHHQCPACGNSYRTTQADGSPSPLAMMAKGIHALAKSKETFRIQFVIPDKSATQG